MGVGTLEIMKSVVGLLFVDVAPGILAEGKEGVTSGNFPRASAPLALTIHPGTALPTTSRKADEWRPHHHRQPRLASLCATSSTPRPRPPGPRQKPCRSSCSGRGNREPRSVSVTKRKVTRHEPAHPGDRCQCSVRSPSGPDLRSRQAP